MLLILLDQAIPGTLDETERVGQRVVDLTQNVVESMHVVMLAIQPEDDIALPIASTGFTPMEEFLSIICHELKTPLTVMRGSLQLAERKVKRLVETDALQPDELRHFAPVQALLERTKGQISIQDRLVDDLLDISRVQSRSLSQ